MEIDIEKLALLARIKLDSKEKKKFQKEFETILDYVSKLKELKIGEVKEADRISNGVKNIMREDENPHKSGEFSEELMEQVPSVEKGYIKVKHILK